MKCYNDFGGVTWKTGDFHTTGFSGMSYTTGDFHTNGTSGLGQMGILDTLLTAEMKSSAKEMAKTAAIETGKYIWQEYKTQIIIGGTLLAAYLALSVAANVKTLAK